MDQPAETVTADRWRIDFDDRGVATLYRYDEPSGSPNNSTIAFARALLDAQTDIARLSRERDEAKANADRWMALNNDYIAAAQRDRAERDEALARAKRMDLAVANVDEALADMGYSAVAKPRVVIRHARAARKETTP